MPRYILALSSLLSFLLIVALSNHSSAEKSTVKPRYTYVIVHGSTGGGWDWKGIDSLLSQNGHVVYRPTLSGLGERVHLANPDIDLSTHINDVANLIRFENLNKVVLVGHSYAGIVITGVMNEIPERIGHAIFLDAFVPDHGMTAFDTWAPAPPEYKVVDGQVVFPWLSRTLSTPGDRPQSLKTFTEPVAFNKPAAKKIPSTYIAFVSPDKAKQRKTWDTNWQRAEKRGWQILMLNSGHNAQRSHPDELSRLLLRAPR